jgi:hypothetical protein
MVNSGLVNAEPCGVFHANFREFFRFFARFLRSENPFNYIRNFNINQKTPHPPPHAPGRLRQFTCKTNRLPSFTFQKGAFAYTCALKNKTGATRKMRLEAEYRVKERLRHPHPVHPRGERGRLNGPLPLMRGRSLLPLSSASACGCGNLEMQARRGKLAGRAGVRGSCGSSRRQMHEQIFARASPPGVDGAEVGGHVADVDAGREAGL